MSSRQKPDALLAPFRLYNDTVGRSPWTEVPTLAGIAGLAGYYGGGALSDRFVESIAARSGGADPDRVDKVKNMLRLGLGSSSAVLAALYAYRKHAMRSTLGTPEERLQRAGDETPMPDWSTPDSTRPFSFGRTKIASSDPFRLNIIPVNQSLDTIHADPYLQIDQKQLVSTLIGRAPTDTYNNTSGRGLVRTALGLGVDFGAAYLFGRVMTGLAGLPSADAKQISIAGGLANALMNTGIFRNNK